MIRSIRLDAVLVQAVIAGALSFAHLHDLAEAAGQSGWKAWAYPISVDLLLVAVWRRLRTDRSKLAWFWFLVALVASLGANIATAGLLDLDHVPAWLRILVAGWPALAFLGGTLLAHSPTDHAPAADPVPRPAPVVDRPEMPEPAPEITTPDPAPALPEAARPPVPPALVDHARKVATEHRARTGTDIDTATLRARLGIPEDLAGAIVAQLA
ncbi:DUF2637 domain-containing protein [Streptomyces resistomycificus]|uniref:SpdA protein n=1 Tax=Streptomyces resistomycificus TaxID=67356 RepID=A0A0L8KYT5_9ACTN|nr:DUF2637 domain-containing protein [Streptomyces resistomycificus]KOG31056.1 SpdA protein [Streptomyces resistomycificus]KUN97034.1 SpdA protein [Streptomyces resistomycificus]